MEQWIGGWNREWNTRTMADAAGRCIPPPSLASRGGTLRAVSLAMTSRTSKSKHALMLDNLGLVTRVAHVIHRRYGLDIPIAELESYGYMGLVEAADRFCDSHDIPFAAYARRRVFGAIIDGLGEDGPNPRPRSRPHRPLRGCATPDLVHDDRTRDAAAALIADETAKRLRAAVTRLPARHRAFVERRYWKGENLSDIGKDFGISKSRASRVHTKALHLLREALAA